VLLVQWSCDSGHTSRDPKRSGSSGTWPPKCWRRSRNVNA